MPSELAYYTLAGHQKDSILQTQGNNLTDQAARETALGDPYPQTILELSAVPEPPFHFHDYTPTYSPEERITLQHGSPSILPWIVDPTRWKKSAFLGYCNKLADCSPQVNAFVIPLPYKKISELISHHVWLPVHWEIHQGISDCC